MLIVNDFLVCVSFIYYIINIRFEIININCLHDGYLYVHAHIHNYMKIPTLNNNNGALLLLHKENTILTYLISS